MPSTPYVSYRPDRILRSFWHLNDELEPRYSVSMVREIDASAMERVRELMAAKSQHKPSYMTFLVAATARVVRDNPNINRRIFSLFGLKRFVQFKNTDIAIMGERNEPGAEAVAFVDVVRDAAGRSLSDLNGAIRAIGGATAENNPQWRLFIKLLRRLPVFLSKRLIGLPGISPKAWYQHRGGAFLVNSPAKYGFDLISGDFLWPFTVSCGFVKDRPFVKNGELCICKTMPLILVFDRRILAGGPAARLFAEIADLLENADVRLL